MTPLPTLLWIVIIFFCGFAAGWLARFSSLVTLYMTNRPALKKMMLEEAIKRAEADFPRK